MCYTFEIKTIQNISENNDVLNFLNNHLNRSLFSYPNINETNIVRGCYITGVLEGIVIISNEKTAMYVLSDDLSIVEYYSILEDAQDYKHIHCYLYNPLDCAFLLYEKNDYSEYKLAVAPSPFVPKYNSKLVISKLEKSKWDQYIHAISLACPEYTVTYDTLKARSNTTTTYIGELDGEIISALTLHGDNSKMYVLSRVLTIPSYQRRGYASQLISNVVHTESLNIRNISLYYNDDNAKSLYHSLGFTQIGDLYNCKKQ